MNPYSNDFSAGLIRGMEIAATIAEARGLGWDRKLVRQSATTRDIQRARAEAMGIAYFIRHDAESVGKIIAGGDAEEFELFDEVKEALILLNKRARDELGDIVPAVFKE